MEAESKSQEESSIHFFEFHGSAQEGHNTTVKNEYKFRDISKYVYTPTTTQVTSYSANRSK